MGKVIDIRDVKFKEGLLNIYYPLDDYSQEDRNYVINNILFPIIPDMLKRMKINNTEVNIDKLRNMVNFYEIMFDLICDRIIMLNADYISDELKNSLKDLLKKQIDIDKDRMLIDDGFDSRPLISEFELDPICIEEYFNSSLNRMRELKVVEGGKKK